MSNHLNVIIFGANGGIGFGFFELFKTITPNINIDLICRTPSTLEKYKSHYIRVHHLSDDWDSSIQNIVESLGKDYKCNYCINAIGRLHDEEHKPEKKLAHLSASQLNWSFNINTVLPALITKHVSQIMTKNNISILAHLSARVGSISDNRLGGWYGYRSAKAALNMLIKTASIEMSRYNPALKIIGLHPGTVATNLSAPFSKSLNKTIFSPSESCNQLYDNVLSNYDIIKAGCVYAYDGSEIPS